MQSGNRLLSSCYAALPQAMAGPELVRACAIQIRKLLPFVRQMHVQERGLRRGEGGGGGGQPSCKTAKDQTTKHPTDS